jgi:membrane protein
MPIMRETSTGEATASQPASAQAKQDSSAGELVKQLSEQVSTLVRDELRLARLEMTQKGKRAGAGIGMLGGGGLVALYGLACLVAAAVIALARAVAPWLAALIIGAGLLAISGAAALLGRGQLQQATPPVPARAAESVKADIEEVKEHAHR